MFFVQKSEASLAINRSKHCKVQMCVPNFWCDRQKTLQPSKYQIIQQIFCFTKLIKKC